MSYSVKTAIALPITLILSAFLFCQSGITQSSPDSTWTFSEIRTDENKDGVPDHLGKNVVVTGVSNTSSGIFHEQYLQIFIQNDSSGLSIFSYNIDQPIVPGDSIKVWGFIDAYNGLVEVEADSYRVYHNRPEPQPLRLDDAIRDPAKYLGMSVEGEGKIIDKGSTFNGKYLLITPNSSSNNIMVYVSNFHTMYADFNFDILEAGDEIAVKGIITEYNPEVPDRKNYKLFLHTPDDLQYSGIPTYYQRLTLWSILGLSLIILGIYFFMRYRVQSKTKDIQLSLKQKELLLKEIHHRVKNSLAIVSGLIEMQSLNTENEGAIRILHDSQSRLQTIAQIHDKLYNSDSLSEIELSTYIKDLVESIHKTFADLNENVTLFFDLDSVLFDSKQVIHIGLLINELVVNSYKHAFKHIDRGTLSVILKKDGTLIQLTVADNGPGLSKEFNPTDDSGLGSMLIQTFAEHLEAEMNVSAPKGGGTSFTFTIPHKM